MAEFPTNSPDAKRPAPQGRVQTQFQDQLSEEYTIDTPENVSFGYEVAGIGSRFVAALIDNLILGVLLVGLNIVLVVALASLAGDTSSVDVDLAQPEESWVAGLVIALYALLNFAIWWGYYMLFEWLWHGQTLGKRRAGIRVVRIDGVPVSFVPVAVRNLVRVVDFLPMGYAVGVITMFCNSQSRRLGDFAAGTLVVKDQGELTLESLMATVQAAPSPKLRTELPTLDAASDNPSDNAHDLTPDQDWSGIRRLTAADYELVKEALARHYGGTLDRALLSRIATAIATKLAQIPSSQVDGMGSNAKDEQVDEQVAFLKAVATAYGRWVK